MAAGALTLREQARSNLGPVCHDLSGDELAARAVLVEREVERLRMLRRFQAAR